MEENEHVKLCDVPTPLKEVFFAVIAVAMAAMASWRAPGVFDVFHLQSAGPKLSVQVFSGICLIMSAPYMAIHLCRAPLLRKLRSRYETLQSSLSARFAEANRAPASDRSVQIRMDHQTDRAILERHYADALDPSRTHATANVIGVLLAVVGGVLLLTTAG
ncbi:TPA: hypothetical protein ACLESW_001416 [Pseudomonas aeruginosa]|uniref:hypothetical protein n=1 Tax=Pseudomonas aeruginosa TaxID=287 RepID=UPI001298731B|nr:hypothetical protein [Pseudomonas aeruginosa]ELK4796412.1 hypothetical protein [Pseudomonas aeruginosa]MBG4551242.1 hypothetical protein [Pseudomonas aeruginosa]MBG5237687.1 hypothetical protein [Pseudomonas aeruginosa]MBH3767392.1 hypothetical protein [Pseudomonas aeruginosa]MBI9181308.1 hypothetical protein [Pseudomonas aeruginosa]